MKIRIKQATVCNAAVQAAGALVDTDAEQARRLIRRGLAEAVIPVDQRSGAETAALPPAETAVLRPVRRTR